MTPAALSNAAFAATFARLREVMLASAKGMIVDKDGAGGLVMNAPIPNPMHPKQPLFFGAVKIGKAYVSYHLMPIYMSEALQARISEPLRKRMQGLSCFNFKAVDEAVFADLAELTAAAAEAFSKPIALPARQTR